MQLREFLLVRYYLSLQLTTDLELAKSKSFLFERNSTIALPEEAFAGISDSLKRTTDSRSLLVHPPFTPL